jgi:membrane-bound ClpP family serine protease
VAVPNFEAQVLLILGLLGHYVLKNSNLNVFLISASLSFINFSLKLFT